MRTTRALILTALLTTAAPAWAQTTTTDTAKPTTSTTGKQTAPKATDTGAITIGKATVFNMAPVGKLSAQKRAEGARSAILSAITPEPGDTVVKPIKLPDDVQTRSINGLPVVTLKGKTIVTITKADGALNGVSPSALADRWAQDLRNAIASLDLTERTAFQAVREEITVAHRAPGTATVPTTTSDTQLATTIRNRLKQDANLREEPISVEVQHGVVTLKGTVRDQRTEQRALETTRKIEGVDQVRSDLRIRGQ